MVTTLRQEEKIWIGLIIVLNFAIFTGLPLSKFIGRTPAMGIRSPVNKDQFNKSFSNFMAQHQQVKKTKVLGGGGIDNQTLIKAPPGDVYLLAEKGFLRPALMLMRGASYRFHMSTFDVQSGFVLRPQNMLIHLVPGQIFEFELTPWVSGAFFTECSAFCSSGCDESKKNQPVGKMIVTD